MEAKRKSGERFGTGLFLTSIRPGNRDLPYNQQLDRPFYEPSSSVRQEAVGFSATFPHLIVLLRIVGFCGSLTNSASFSMMT